MWDLVLTVSASSVRLSGCGEEVTAPHHGVQPGLRNALHDVRRERSRRRDLAAAGVLSLRHAGDLLAASFLPDPVAATLARVLRRATAAHTPVRLGVVAPELWSLPWEALPVDGRPLVLHDLVSVYRRVAGAVPTAPAAGPLRIVVAIASPEFGGGPLLDYERELGSVLDAVHQAHRSQATVRIVPFATTAAIRAVLDEDTTHVLHLSAHGAPGILHLEDEDGNARAVDPETLVSEAIPAGRMPRVISLAACYTDAEGDAGSFAAQLAQRGAGAVIATQTSVTDVYATRLFAAVYGELAGSPSPDVVGAVAEARRRVQRDFAAGGDPLAQAVAGLDEWSVVSVLAGAPSVTVVDTAAEPEPRAESVPDVGDLTARPVGQFVGRRHAQRTLPGLLSGESVSGVLLHGIGGIGKTTLAAEVVRRLLDLSPQWRLVTLSGPATADRLLAAVAAAARRHLVLQGEFSGVRARAVTAADRLDLPWQDRFEILRDQVLTEARILVVLDNFEDNLVRDGAGWAIGDAALAGLLSVWCARPGRSRLLVTCRYRFGDLHDYQVPPLSLAETRKLLWSLPRLDRHAGDTGTQERIWRTVGGHPRALEYLDALLAGGAVEGRFADITRRLLAAADQRLGAEEAARWRRRQRTLDAALAETVTLAADDVLLSEHLERLAGIPGAIRLLAAISVFREPVEQRSGPLGELAATSLVTVLGDGRVVMHRWTASELHRLWEDRLVTASHRAAAAYWVRRADQGSRVHDLEEARHHFFCAGETDSAVAVTEEISVRLHEGGAWDREYDLIHETLGWLPAGSPRRPGWYYQLGKIAQERGDYVEADRRYRQALPLFAEAGLPAGEADSYHQLGILAHLRGDHLEALRRYEQALTLNSAVNNRRSVAAGHHQIGMLAHDRGDVAEAERRCRQSLAIEEELGNRLGIAVSLHQLGILAQERGDVAEAERLYQRSLAIKEELGNRPGLSSSYHQLGLLAQARGDADAAEHRYQQALANDEELGDRPGMAVTQFQLALIAYGRGDHNETERLLRLSLAIDEELGNRAGAVLTFHNLGVLCAGTGRFAEAVAFHGQALAAGLELQLPHTANSVAVLRELRAELGSGTFQAALAAPLDEESVRAVTAAVDQVRNGPVTQ